MNIANVERYLAMVAQLLPPPDHTFDAPSVPAVPTEADVRAATARLIDLEQIAAELPDRMRHIDYIAQALSFEYVNDEADEDLHRRVWDALLAADAVKEAHIVYQQLLHQQIGHWQAALAVMEHDLAWQQSIGTQTRNRPSPAHTLYRVSQVA